MVGGTLVSVARVMFAVDTPQLKTDLSESERVVRSSGNQMANDLQQSGRRARTELDGIGRGALGASGLLQGLGRTVAFASASFIGGYGLAYAVKAAFDEMETGRRVTAQTNAVITSTGGIAGVTSRHVDGLAKSLQDLSGQNQNVIRSEEDVLLTFTNVRNVVGQGNDVFDQATRAALDMSVALKEDLKDASIQVGKALNDPVKGITALRRVGVQFSTDQVDLIKHMVATNNVIGAQKLILHELQVEFGGSAKAAGQSFPGQLEIAKQHLLELGASITTGFTPQLRTAGDWIDRESKLLAGNTEQHRELENAVHDVTGAIGDGISVLRTGFGVFQQFGQVVGGDKQALELLGEVWVGLKVAHWANDFNAASLKAGGLLGNLRNLVKMGTITIGITTLINGLKTPGPKGFLEQLLGAGAIGWAVGGPGGAMVSITADVLYNILKKPGSTDPSNPTSADYTYTVGQYKGRGIAVKGAPGDTEVGILLRRAAEGKKLSAADSKLLTDYAKSHTNDGSFLGFKSLADALNFYKDSNVYNLARDPSGKTANAPKQGAGIDAGTGGPSSSQAIVKQARARGVGSGGIYGESGGGAGAKVGGTVYYDCSGYAQAVFQSAGFKNFPRTSEAQYAATSGPNWVAKDISPSDAQPGDLVFYNYDNGYPLPASHVAIVVSGAGLTAKTIEYTSSGKPAVYGTVGEGPLAGAKRYSLVKQAGGAGGTTNAPGNGGYTNKKKAAAVSNFIPDSMSNAVKEAELAGNKGAELKGLEAIDSYLTKLLAKTTNVKKRGQILDELISTKSQITSLKAKPTADLIPPALQLALDKAHLTKSINDDLTALDAIDAYLTKKLAKTKKVKDKIAILQQLQSTRGEESTDTAKLKVTDLAAIPGMAAVLSLFSQASSGKVTTNAELPGVGKILLSFAPTIADWSNIVQQLSKKLKAANERKAALQRSLAKAQKAKHKNPTLVARLKAAIKTISTTISDLQSDIGDALLAIKDLQDTATSAAQQAAKEAEAAAQQAAADASQNFSDAMSAAGTLPPEIDLAMAQAEGTVGTGDDIAALDRAAAYYQNELDSGQVQTASGVFALDTATKAAITRQLNGINDQITQIDNNAKQTSVDIGASFLTALRGLQQFQNTVLSPLAPLFGNTIQVTNNFQSGPTDPHLYAASVEFELKALVG